MIHKIIEKMTNFFSQNMPDKKEIIGYGIRIVVMNTPKTIALIVLGIILGILPQILLIMALYGLIRFFSYGFHFESSIACFIFGTIMYLLGAYLSLYIKVANVAYILIFLAVFTLYLLYAPCGTVSHPIGKKQYIRNKKITLAVVFIMATLGFFSETGFRTAVIYSVTYQAINITPLIFKIFKQKGGIIYDE